jgi:hypothetical protein
VFLHSTKTEAADRLYESPGVLTPDLLSLIPVPAGVEPLALAEDKRLGGSSGLRGGVSGGFDFVQILGVDGCGVTVDLRLGVGKFEALQSKRGEISLCASRPVRRKRTGKKRRRLAPFEMTVWGLDEREERMSRGLV